MADRYLLESGAPDGYLLEDGSGVLLLEVADSASPKSWFADGNAPAVIGAALLAGVMSFWGAATEFAPTQPKPQTSQWSFASRDTGGQFNWFGKQITPAAAPQTAPTEQFFVQPQVESDRVPAYWKGIFPAVVASTLRPEQFFVFGQSDLTQPQPAFWKQQLDLIYGPSSALTLSPNQVEPDRQPAFFRAIFGQVAAQPTLVHAFYILPRESREQPQPLFVGQTPGQRTTPTIRSFVAAPQDDPTQIQPLVIKQTTGQRERPVIRAFYPTAQEDSTGPQPRFDRQQPAPVIVSTTFVWTSFFLSPQSEEDRQPRFWQQAPAPAVQTVPFKFLTAAPQEDPTQIQPVVWEQTAGQREQPVIRSFTAAPQEDPSQLPTKFFGETFSQLPVPPNRFYFLSPEPDTTQRHGVMFKIAEIPSVTPPVSTWNVFIINE